MVNSYEITTYKTAEGTIPWIEWLSALRDVRGRFAIAKRIERLKSGNFGDHKSLGGGLWELRIDYGPGYRAYYCLMGRQIVLLLCGGDKQTQQQDINRARTYKNDYEQR